MISNHWLHLTHILPTFVVKRIFHNVFGKDRTISNFIQVGTDNWHFLFEGDIVQRGRYCKNITTGETSQAITPFHFFGYFNFLSFLPCFLEWLVIIDYILHTSYQPLLWRGYFTMFLGKIGPYPISYKLAPTIGISCLKVLSSKWGRYFCLLKISGGN